MLNYIPKEINIDRSNTNKLIISSNKKDLAISDYLAILYIAFFYIVWIFFNVMLFTSKIEIFSSIVFIFIILLILFAFNTRLLLSLIISLKEKQSLIISKDYIVIIKKRPFCSRYYKVDRSKITKIDLEIFGFISFFLPTAIVRFKHYCNIKYYEAPRIISSEKEYYIFEHFRYKVRVWIIDYLNSEIN
jgi:hypothetical protein